MDDGIVLSEAFKKMIQGAREELAGEFLEKVRLIAGRAAMEIAIRDNDVAGLLGLLKEAMKSAYKLGQFDSAMQSLKNSDEAHGKSLDFWLSDKGTAAIEAARKFEG